MDRLRKVLVTGGAGFVGSHTVDKLVDRGYEVRVYDNLDSQVHPGLQNNQWPEYINQKAEYVFGDIRDTSKLKQALGCPATRIPSGRRLRLV